MLTIIIILLFTLGAIIGSFLNVLIYRLPRKESILFPASHCPICHHSLRIRDNIPIMSYLMLRGHCFHCQSLIPIRYFLVELISAMSWVVLYFKFGLSIDFALQLVLISILIVCTYTDLDHRRILNSVLLFGFGVGLTITSLLNPTTIPDSIVGMAAGLAFMLFWAVIGKLLFRQTALGSGDIKLAAMIGIFTGAKFILLILILSFTLATLYIIFPALKSRNILGRRLPLAPFIAVSTLITILFGNELIQSYLDLVF